jgi:arsenate reductase
LTDKGIEFESIDYTKQRLSANQLKQLLQRAALSPHDALRTNEAAYRQHVAGRNLSDEELIHLMVRHPELIQRPIIVRGDKAVLARPVDKLADLGIK